MKKLIFVLLTGILFAACQTAPQKILSNKPGQAEAQGPLLPKAVVQQKEAWQQALNTKPAEELATFYRNDAALMWGRNLFQEASLVAEQWKYWQTGLSSLQRQGTHSVVKQDEEHYLEMGYYEFSQKDPTIYAYVTVWTRSDGRWLRELEVVEPLMEERVEQKGIDRARSLWVERSNERDPGLLTAESYAEDAYYVNQGKYYQGAEAIGEVYSYMSQPGWEITLRSKAVLPVQPGLVFELGEYESNGIGRYVIIWELHAAGVWKVLLDFNF